MRKNISTFALISLLLFISLSMMGKDTNKIPNKEAKEWHDNLHGSPYSVYENFDGTMIEYKSIASHLTDTVHLKFLMGCSGADDKKMEYRMFMIFINGEEIEHGYINDYSLIFYAKDNMWILSDKDELDSWTKNWEGNLDKLGLPYLRAFLIPNDDVKELNMKDIYLSFGLEKTTVQDSVKLLLCNQMYKPTDTQAKGNQAYNDDIVYMDACMPCPKVCGNGGQ
jgi:hypothetical protein